ncbi:MAG: tripartite tricarboxylate transporter substrate binding protein [Hydrogenophaga sp.]|nr:tripartite tricarboxylate transporter substrate binding protein [Hydrogenophaga sp.]
MFKNPRIAVLLRTCLGIAALALALACTQAHAQAWPTRTIVFVVPYAVGGPADALARMVARKMSETTGQPVVVENKAGAGGTIGVAAAIKSAPDGYTFALTGPGPLAGMPTLMKMPYTTADYQHITLVARVPSVIVVNTDSGLNTLADLVARAKAQPGALNYGSAGGGTTPHIAVELLKQEAAIHLTHVPYKGAAPAVTALLGGEVQLAMVDLTPVLQHANAGRLRILAVAGNERAPQQPRVPTTRELGLPGVTMDTNYGVIAPRGIPADIQKKAQDAFAAALNSSELKEQFLKQGAVAMSSTPQEYASLMTSEYEKWQQVVARGKITLD